MPAGVGVAVSVSQWPAVTILQLPTLDADAEEEDSSMVEFCTDHLIFRYQHF